MTSCGGGSSSDPPGGGNPPTGNFSDDFSTDTRSNYLVTNTMTQGGTGNFLYDSLGQRGQISTGDNIALQISTNVSPLSTGTFLVDFLPTNSFPSHGGVYIRLRQDLQNYYEISNFDGVESGTLKKIVNGTLVESKSLSNLYSQGINYTVMVSFSPTSTNVNAFGNDVTINTNNSDIQVSSFEIEFNQQDGYLDNIILTNSPVVTLTSPQSGAFQWNHSLDVQASAFNLPGGGGIKFIVDSGTGIVVTSEPYGATFSNVKGGFHSVSAIAVDSTGAEVSGNLAWDQSSNVELGDYYVAMGDSITKGSHDSIPFPDGGFEPLLKNQLQTAKGYSQKVVNEGISGDTSAVGVGYISALLNQHPDSSYFLILYGSNDAIDGVSTASFKSNMEAIVNSVINAGRTPYLSKVPFFNNNDPSKPVSCPTCDASIISYNNAIDQIVSNLGIAVAPPDFYTHFKNNTNELADGLHPNHSGYQSMANLWQSALP